jgi:DNA-directed RNA polymerase subunit M/transcription elongation factor TFIIS
MLEARNKGRNALNTVLKEEKNLNVIEKQIYKLSNNNTDDYILYVYQAIGDIINKTKLKNIMDNLKKNKIGWNHTSFDKMAIFIEEQNDFIKNPFEVEEGVFQCKSCGSKRVFSYTKQDRSSDEPLSVYAQCVACKTKWKERT